MLRPVFKTLSLATFAVLAAASVAAGSTVTVSDVPTSKTAAFAAGAKPPASVKVRTCRSGAYYDNRLISFRALMSRFSDTNAPQKLEMRLDVLRMFHENTRYKKVKADGLGVWTSSSDSASAYQRDLVLTNVETDAYYKARVAMRWVDSAGNIEWHRTITSKLCFQKTRLPKLKITAATSVPVAGSTDMVHTITVKNAGRSEAVNVPISVSVDAVTAATGIIDSLGPKQSYDIQLRAPACNQNASAWIDPSQTNRRPIKVEPFVWQLSPCK